MLSGKLLLGINATYTQQRISRILNGTIYSELVCSMESIWPYYCLYWEHMGIARVVVVLRKAGLPLGIVDGVLSSKGQRTA